MTATRVKICGLTTAADRDAAIRAGADALGFISSVPVDSPREIPPAKASELVAKTPPLVTSVLVTMPETVSEAVELYETVEPDAIQIHGTLSPDQLDSLADRIEVPVIAAVDVTEPNISAYADAADTLLVDSTRESGGGGTGRTHDWERTRELVRSTETPLILAGGLDSDNVETAIETVEPFGVDTASGVERQGGRKDHEAVRRFVRAARQTQVVPREQQKTV